MESLWGSALRFETVAVIYATLCTCRRLQLNKMPASGHNAAQRGGQSGFNAVSDFSPFHWIFSSFPHEGKIQCALKRKKCTTALRKKIGCAGLGWAGAGREGPAGVEPGRDGARGRAGGGLTCVFLHKNVRRNRLKYLFGAVCRGKNRYFSPDFFREVPDFALYILDFFRGKNQAKSRGKSCTITNAISNQLTKSDQWSVQVRWSSKSGLPSVSLSFYFCCAMRPNYIKLSSAKWIYVLMLLQLT